MRSEICLAPKPMQVHLVLLRLALLRSTQRLSHKLNARPSTGQKIRTGSGGRLLYWWSGTQLQWLRGVPVFFLPPMLPWLLLFESSIS